MLIVYALGRIFNAYKSVYFLYKMKAEIMYFVARGYKNMSVYELTVLTVLRQMLHIKQCIVDGLFVKV